jgi:hypothetical protein
MTITSTDGIDARPVPLLERCLELGYIAVAIVLGTLQAWPWRDFPSTVDAVSYLDVGEAYFQGRWTDAINGYWNPLYSWILGGVMTIVRPPSRLLFPTMKMVDVALYVCCVLAFSWFLANLRQTYRVTTARDAETGAAIPDLAWIVVGYSVFIWSSIRWITLISNTPDMSGAALTYITWGLLFRLERRERLPPYALLGVTLALSYFARTPMFIVAAVVFVLLSLPRGGWHRVQRRGAIVAATVFLVTTMPFVASISKARGHVTIGDNGLLNHVWLTNPGSYKVPNRHWQGGPPGNGSPRHPSRLVFESPQTFEFSRPIGGTFPPWTDPSYWYEGLRYHFDAAAELVSLESNAWYYGRLFFFAWLAVLIAALGCAGRIGATLTACRRNIRYWLPPLSGLVVYLFAVNLPVQPLPTQPPERYVAVFIVLFSLGSTASLRFRSHPFGLTSKRLLILVTAVASLGVLGGATITVARGPRPTSQVTPWQIAEKLEQAGVLPGYHVATIGSPDQHDFWAKLASVQIIAEIPNLASFWSKPPEVRQKLVHSLARFGIRAVVAPWVRPSAVHEGWRMLPGSSYGVYLISDPPGDAAEARVRPGELVQER